MKYKGKNKYTARFLGCLVFIFVMPFILILVIFDALKIAANHVYTEMAEFTNDTIIDGWKSWNQPSIKK